MKRLSMITLIVLLVSACGKKEDGSSDLTGDNDDQTTPCTKTSVTLSWTPPTSREDGSPLELSELYGYTIFWGTASYADVGTYSDSLVIANPHVVSHKIENLDSTKKYYFSITSRDDNGLESRRADEVEKDLAKARCSTATQNPRTPRTPSRDLPDIDCKDTIHLKYYWKSLDRISNYKMSVGYLRGRVSDQFELARSDKEFDIEVKRGKIIYTKLFGVKNNSISKQTKEYQYTVMTCEQLAKKLAKNPRFKEKLDIKMKWNK